MVLVHILLALRTQHRLRYDVGAVHIDYANRDESTAEAAFVRSWCDARGVRLRVRVVCEVTREVRQAEEAAHTGTLQAHMCTLAHVHAASPACAAWSLELAPVSLKQATAHMYMYVHRPSPAARLPQVTSRDEYEKVSRAIRFAEYEAASAEWGGRGIFFGHHEGDLHENVISNVMKGAQLLNIAGISEASTVNDVLIYRPMLPYPKAAIYDYAHKYGVAYFKDTTPKWSTRGKLRNQLQPLLQDVYGEVGEGVRE